LAKAQGRDAANMAGRRWWVIGCALRRAKFLGGRIFLRKRTIGKAKTKEAATITMPSMIKIVDRFPGQFQADEEDGEVDNGLEAAGSFWLAVSS
jgi:hypothetical protein